MKRLASLALTAGAAFVLGFAGPANSAAPTPTLTRRPWATITPTRTPWPIERPCDADPDAIEEGSAAWDMRGWVLHWLTWIEIYRQRGWHDLPAEIVLGVIMQESRGSPAARGADGEIGIMQVLPSSVGASVAELEQSTKNLFHGIGLLESYTFEARYYASQEYPLVRDLRYESVAEAADLAWWFSFEGWTALAMYQCGPGNIGSGGACGRNGGYRYAQTVLTCWVPWVQAVLDENDHATESPGPPTATEVVTAAIPATELLPRTASYATLQPSAEPPLVGEEHSFELVSFFVALVGVSLALFVAHFIDRVRSRRGS